jgi:hypothetical protein
MKRFEELRLKFRAVQQQFEQAKTLEQRQQLVVISKQIISDADSVISEFRTKHSLR